MDDISPKISIIVPVYNVEQYLTKCIESILAQNFTNFELLLINDGSMDASGEICDDYAQKDDRVKVYHKENGGVSSARNLGIEQSLGEYICFVDSDDWLEQEYIDAFFLDNIGDRKTLIIQDLLYDTIKGSSKRYYLKKEFLKTNQFLSAYTEYKILNYPSPYCKLYNAEIIKSNQIVFNINIHFAEDLLFFLNYIQYIDSVRFIDKAYYHYVDHNQNSLSKNYYSSENEYYIFSLIKYNLNVLSIRHKINIGIISSSQTYLETHLMRSITSLYRPKFRKKRNDRLFLLKEWASAENIKILSTYSGKYSIKSTLFPIFLLQKKHLILFDLFMNLMFTIRYRHERLWKKLV